MTVPRFENPPYYITAYGLAVKRGFKGTLDEWIASLKGEKGDQGDKVELRYLEDKIQWRWVPDAGAVEDGASEEAEDAEEDAVGEAEDSGGDAAEDAVEEEARSYEWQDLIDVAGIRGEIIEQTLDTAQRAAATAEEMALRADDVREAAASAAREAAGHAQDAAAQANFAEARAGEAAQAASEAEQSCTDAMAAAETAAAAASEAVNANKNKLPQPGSGASVGQFLQVTEVDEQGRVTGMEAVEAPGGNDYTLPVAADDRLGGVRPVTKTEEMTQPVGVDENGKLWIAPIGSGETPAVPGSHTITWDLENVTSSNGVTSVSSGGSLVAVLTPADGYTLGEVAVTMGGEALPGAWNSDTAAVTIPSVTGDVVISCTGMEKGSADTDTSPVILQENVGYSASLAVTEFEGLCITKVYPFEPDIDGLKASAYYDAENDYLTYAGVQGGIVVYAPKIKMLAAGLSTTGMSTKSKIIVTMDGAASACKSNTSLTNSSEESGTAEVRVPFDRYSTTFMYCNGIAFTLSMLDADDSYAYWYGTTSDPIFPVGVSAGDIIFAGRNTPYYGMKNIDGTLLGDSTEEAAAAAIDSDYAQDYGVSALSIVTEEAENVATGTGLDAAYAAVIEEAKNAWMLEANGSVDKIPLIIHTDQHSNFSKSLWDTISQIVDWYEISKVVNLGDTVNTWVDADTEHPLTKDNGLESYLASMKSVPYSKRIEVFGNHDTWQSADGSYIGLTPQNYLRKYFKNIYARTVDNYGNMVVCDDRYNVKYLVISGMAYDSDIGGYSHFVIPSASWEWIISQLEKADGYDVVVISHVPLGRSSEAVTDPTGETTEAAFSGGVDAVTRTDFWTARKSKNSGNFTDQYGVAHAYDFTNCDGELLCGLHGHQHYDGYYYIGNALLDVFFDAYYIDPKAIHFILIDRENRQLNVWKVDDTPQYQNYQIPLDKSAE